MVRPGIRITLAATIGKKYLKMENERALNTTNTLRGIAISAVLINHYLNLNVSGDNRGFANLFTSIFFVLSGYGIFLSLDRRFSTTLCPKEIISFYYQRFIRLFPLLWLAWSIEFVVRGGNLSLWILLGIHGTGHYWFIPALLQCYILSPLIYLLMRKKPIISIGIIITVFVIINFVFLKYYIPFLFFKYYIPPAVIRLAIFAQSNYRGMYFLQILIFAFGFSIAMFASAKRQGMQKQNIIHNVLFWFFTFLIVILMIKLKQYNRNSQSIRWVFLVGPLFPIVLLCIYSLVFSIENRLFGFLGSISYSIYLFHMSFYLLLTNGAVFPKNSIKEFTFLLLLFPVFIIACYYIESFGRYIARKLNVLQVVSTARPGAAPDRYSAGAP